MLSFALTNALVMVTHHVLIAIPVKCLEDMKEREGGWCSSTSPVEPSTATLLLSLLNHWDATHKDMGARKVVTLFSFNIYYNGNRSLIEG